MFRALGMQVKPEVLRFRHRRGAGEFNRVTHLSLDRLSERGEHFRGYDVFISELPAEPLDRIFLPPRLDFGSVLVFLFVARMVAAIAVGGADEETWPLTRTRPGNRPSRPFAPGEHLHAINCFGRNIESGAARFWTTSGRHVLACSEFAIDLVLANK